MDCHTAVSLLDVIGGADQSAATEAADRLARAVWPLEIAAGIQNCRDALVGKWGAAGSQILRVSLATLRQALHRPDVRSSGENHGTLQISRE